HYVEHNQRTMPPSLGEFEQLVLLSLVRLGPDAYGAAVRREIEARAGRELSISAVYTTLERLEQKGYVRSWVGEPTTPRGGPRGHRAAIGRAPRGQSAACGDRWLAAASRDVRTSARMLVHAPGFAIVAVLTLALGVGANVAMFAVVNAILFKPLPFRQADRLML